MKLKTCPRAMALLLCMVMLLSLAGTAFASASVTPAYGYVVANQAVNVRTGPNSSYSVLGWLQQGSYATVTGIENSGWIQVSYNGGYGYVNPAYVNTSNIVSNAATIPTVPVVPTVPTVPTIPTVPTVPVVPSVVDPVTPVVGGTSASQYYVSASRLNIRSGPGTKYSVLGTLSRGQVVTKVGKSGNWTQIQLSSGYGYVYTKYISAAQTAVPTVPTVPTIPTTPITGVSGYYYATASLNIRSGPGENYPVIGTVSAGSIVRSLGSSGGYTRIQVSGSGYTAYVSSSYLIGYLYADAASRVVYPSCTNYGYGYGGYNPYGYNYGYYNLGYGYGYYRCTKCGRTSPTSICPTCGGRCVYGSSFGGCYSSCGYYRTCR